MGSISLVLSICQTLSSLVAKILTELWNTVFEFTNDLISFDCRSLQRKIFANIEVCFYVNKAFWVKYGQIGIKAKRSPCLIFNPLFLLYIKTKRISVGYVYRYISCTLFILILLGETPYGKLVDTFLSLNYTNMMHFLVSQKTWYPRWSCTKFMLKAQLLTLLKEEHVSNLHLLEGLFTSVEELPNCKNLKQSMPRSSHGPI